MPRIADQRQMNIEEVDASFEELARAQIRKWRREGVAEDRVATIKSKLKEDNATDEAIIAAATGMISQFVLGFKNLFLKPRKRKTPWGRYGLETESELIVKDEEALLQELTARGCDDCIKVTRSVLKSKVTERIARGEKFDGCRISAGDVVKYNVDKNLVDEVSPAGNSAGAQA